MKTRRYALVHSILGLAALTGCVATADTQEEATKSSSAALTLPNDANWASGVSPDAIVIGKDTDGAPLYSCRAPFNNSIAPGKTRAGWGVCDFGYGGTEQQLGPFQTLTPQWTSAQYGNVPPNGISYGVDHGRPLYVCRALTPSFQWQTGKVGAGIAGCDYPYGGREVTAASYEVLTNKTQFDIAPVFVARGAALPYNAIRGGTDSNGAAIYPCIAPYNGDQHPGKTEPGWGVCDISYAGSEVYVSSGYQVLVPQLTAPPLGVAVNEYVGGTDTNGTSLGICTAPYGSSLQVGKYLSSGVCDFGYGGHEMPVTSGVQVLAIHLDPSPIVYTFSNITFPSGTAIGGSAQLTLNPDGSWLFTGGFHDSGAVDYNESTLVAVQIESGLTFTFGRNGHTSGTVDCPIFDSCPNRNDTWSLGGNNPGIAQHWADLKRDAIVSQTSTVTPTYTPDWSQLWTDVKTGLETVGSVIAVVGPILAGSSGGDGGT